MEEISETDEFVTPYRLCDICTDIVGICTENELWDVESRYAVDDADIQFPSESIIPPLNTPLRCHATFAQLRQSADRGCHLCVLLANAKSGKMESGSRLSLRLARSRHTRYRNCQTIELRIGFENAVFVEGEHGLSEVGEPVRIHRHTCDGTANRCTVEPENRLDASLESQYRWCKNTRLPVGFKMLRSLLWQCIDHHEICRLKLSGTKPTRLLDLDAFPASKNIRLVLAKEVEVEAYATLSYRWGGTNSFTLKTANYESLRSRIQLEDLPRTIQDAIEVCRGLSMRYLWVDALCILQESGEDFSREVANMASIYANSLFTVAAADTLDSEATFFTDRDPLRKENCVLIESDEVRWVFEKGRFAKTCGWHQYDVQVSPLNQRGWVFQEHRMSPRTIHFTLTEIVWDCRERALCQGCASNNSLGADATVYPWSYGKKAFVSLFKGLDQREQKFPFQEVWLDVLETYSGTELTNMDDRLSALAGIAQLIEEKLHYEASYGLWLSFFYDQLQWRTYDPEGPRIKEIDDCVPSWSWASIRGGVYMDMQDEDIQLLRTAKIKRYPPVTSFKQISVLHKQLPPPVSFEVYGWIRSCRVSPRRKTEWSAPWTLLPASEELPIATEALTNTAWDASLANDETKLGIAVSTLPSQVSEVLYHPDSLLDRRENLVCLLLKRRRVGNVIIDSGLVLHKTDSEKAIYKRVGYFDERIREKDIDEHYQASKSYLQLPSEFSAERDRPEHAVTQLIVSDKAVLEESGRRLAETNTSDDTTELGVPDNAATTPTASHIASQGNPEDCETEKEWQKTIKQLTLFNGAETEAEIEIA